MKHPHPTSSILKPIAFLVASFAIAQGADSDFDGLDDAVKTNTGIYVSPSHTESSPGAVPAIVSGLSMATTFDAAPVGNGRLIALETRTCDSVIETDSFSIKEGETIRLNQPGSRSTIIIRVTGNAPSVIAGKLVSNGKVILLSPGGIEITASGQIESDGFVASTLEQLDGGFRKDRSMTLRGSSEARLSNAGKWSAPSGDIILIGRVVSNKGSIETKHGNVVMAASSEVTLGNDAGDCLFVRIPTEAKEGDVEQTGVIKAAYKMWKEPAGNHEFVGETAEGGAIMMPVKRTHGRVEIHAGTGRARVSGSVEGGCQEAGGAIVISGREVTIDSDANIDASGDYTAGSIKIGGGYQGKDDSITNSQMTRVMGGSIIKADCHINGNGGSVIVWSDQKTDYLGQISVRGGAQGGNGGFVEVSGKQALGFEGEVDTSSYRGSVGTLLLDPTNINVASGGTKRSLVGAVGNDGRSNQYSFGEDPGYSEIDPSVIVGLLDSTNVILQASNNITITNSIDASAKAGNGYGLTLQAGNDISVSATGAITTRGGAITLSANNDPSGTATGSGGIFLNAALNTTAGSQTNGAVTLTVDGGTGGINLGSNITTAGATGNVIVSSGSGGIFQLGGTTINAGSGTISLNAGGGAIDLSNGTLTTTNATASAVDLQNATTVSLGNVNATNGTLNIGVAGNVTSSVSQTGGTLLDANTLTGSTNDSVSLNGSNTLANLGAFTSGGNFSLNDLGGLTVTASPVTNAGSLSISTTGVLEFTNTLTLTGNSVLNAGAGAINFNSTVNGAFSLEVETTGATTFSGEVGGVTRLTSLTSNAGGNTVVNANMSTSGVQTFNDAVTTNAGRTLTASTVNLNNNLFINGGGVGQLHVTGATFFGAGSSFVAQVSGVGTANHDRLVTTGAVTITNGATMSVNSVGGYVWNSADSFTMIDNDGSDAIVGTFNGPTLANFLGSTSTAARSYTGGTGNDLVFAASPVNLSINDITLNEGNAGTTNFTFTISLSSPAPAGGITFDIATANGTASTTNSDYVTKSLASQTIPAGSSSYIFVVTVNGDAVFESNENFFVNVTNVSGSGVVVTDGQGLGTITNDDAADTDNDGVNDSQEVIDGTNPLVADSDGDGLSDGEEKTRTTNPLLADTDGDTYSDGYEVQNSSDPKSSASFPTYTLTLANNGTAIGGTFAKSGTLAHGTSATLTATALPGYLFGSWTGDASGLTNPLNILMDADKTVGATFVEDTRDPDADGLTNYQEIILRLTDPNLPDTDGDGVTDGQEVTDGTNPKVADSDSDGLNDGEEKARGTNPLSGDSDGDGLGDGQEANLTSTNPLAQDSDGNGIADAFEDPDKDGILNGREVNERNTNPKSADSDNDGLSDTYELVFKGTTDAFKPRIGDRLRFDLRELGFQGTYRLVGKLPVGMTFNATTGVLEGKLTGKAATSALTIQILNGTTVVRSIPLSLPIGAFPTTLTGKWQALLEDANGLPQGLVTATLKAPGKWSATLDVAASKTIRKATGTFDLQPAATSASMAMTFPAATGLTAQTLTLGVSGPDALASGSHPQGNLRGFRLARGAELPASTKAFTMVIDQGEQDGFLTPAGIGWATGVISTKGSITLSGQLGDAQAIKGSMKLGATGQALLWLKPYRNLSSRIGGVVSLHETGAVPATALAQNDSGLWWSRAADAAELSYPGGFAAIPAEVGVRGFAAKTSSLALASSLGLTQQTFSAVLFDGGGLPDPNAAAALPESFALDASFKLIAAPIPGRLMAPWQGAVNSKTGSFSGTLDVVASTTGIIPGKAAVSGVLFPSAEGNDVVGAGLVKIPVAGRTGSFRTGAVVLSR